MASGLIPSWQIGKKMEAVRDFIILALKSLWMVTEAMKLKDASSLEEKLDSLLKRRDITLSTKIHLVKAMVFPVVMYRCDELDHKEG